MCEDCNRQAHRDFLITPCMKIYRVALLCALCYVHYVLFHNDAPQTEALFESHRLYQQLRRQTRLVQED